MAEPSPSRLSDFEVQGCLGSGSFGRVYKVLRLADGRVYVMKQISLESMTPREQLDAINEVKIMAALNHPNVVRYYDSFLEGNQLQIIMEYCDAGDLQKFLKKSEKEDVLPREDIIWKFFLQICIALQYLHSQRILHRDIKSANIFMTRGGIVKIGDLGVAKVLGTNTGFARTCVGTPYYLSPELCEDKPYNEKSDVWALGCVLYECCTLKHPFDARNQGALILKIIQGQYERVNSTKYTPELCSMVDRLLKRDTKARPSVEELLAEPVCVRHAEALGLELPEAVLKLVRARMEVVPKVVKSPEGKKVAPGPGAVARTTSSSSSSSIPSRRLRRGGSVTAGAGAARKGKPAAPVVRASSAPKEAADRKGGASPVLRFQSGSGSATPSHEVVDTGSSKDRPRVTVGELDTLSSTLKSGGGSAGASSSSTEITGGGSVGAASVSALEVTGPDAGDAGAGAGFGGPDHPAVSVTVRDHGAGEAVPGGGDDGDSDVDSDGDGDDDDGEAAEREHEMELNELQEEDARIQSKIEALLAENTFLSSEEVDFIRRSTLLGLDTSALATGSSSDPEKFKVMFRLAHFYDLWKANFEKLHGTAPPV